MMTMVIGLAILAVLVIIGLTGLLFHGCDLRDTNSQSTSPAGKIRTSAAAIWSNQWGFAGILFNGFGQ
jgi:hypothetical protein